MSRILRYEVPVDGEWHVIKNVSPALHVACRRIDAVEFWAHPLPVERNDEPITRAFRVYGTGHDIDDNALYVGTALTPDNQFVWHLMAKWVKP